MKIKILVAYNNAPGVILNRFFESCADEARRMCFDNGFDHTLICPPDMNEDKIIGEMENHHVCFISSHGDNFGIYNDNHEYVVSTKTTNYVFDGKMFYSVCCSCGLDLCRELRRLGLKLFVGYNKDLNIRGDETPFVTSTMSGLKSLLEGNDKEASFIKMLDTFDEQIEKLMYNDPFAAEDLLRDKESLVFDGDSNFSLTDLQ